jgi:hypothetical protein
VPAPQAVPVQLLQLPVALELADDVAVVEGDAQLAADLLPALQLLGGQAEPLGQLGAAVLGEQLQGLQGPAQDPGGHHVGVSVVVQAGLVAAGVAIVVLVWAHHPADLVAVEGVVVAGDAGPEAGDL